MTQHDRDDYECKLHEHPSRVPYGALPQIGKDCGKSLAAVLNVDHAVAGRNCAIADEVERKRLA